MPMGMTVNSRKKVVSQKSARGHPSQHPPASTLVNSGMRKTATIRQVAMGRIRRTE